MTTPLPTGAWNLWRDEVRAGVRSERDVDWLWHAAWCDAWGIERLEDGIPDLAQMWFNEAGWYLRRMAAQERAA